MYLWTYRFISKKKKNNLKTLPRLSYYFGVSSSKCYLWDLVSFLQIFFQ